MFAARAMKWSNPVSRDVHATRTFVDDLDDADQRLRRARISAAERLNNMVGEGSDIADTLEAIGYREPAVAAIREAVAQLRVAALTIEPRRGQERS